MKIPLTGSHVRVSWYDSERLDGWRDLSLDRDLPLGLKIEVTYGRIIERHKRGMVVASTLSVNAEQDKVVAVLSPLWIWYRCIDSILVLDEPDL